MTEDELRKKIIILCGIDSTRLMLCPGKYNLYYRCPRYERRNRKKEQKVCTNRISIRDKSILVNELFQIYTRGELISGLHGEIAGLIYTVDEINDFYITVRVTNTRTIRKESLSHA